MCLGEACKIVSYSFEWSNGDITAAAGQEQAPDMDDADILDELKNVHISQGTETFALDVLRDHAKRRKLKQPIITVTGTTVTLTYSSCGGGESDCTCRAVVDSKPEAVEDDIMSITIEDLPGGKLPGKYDTFSVTLTTKVHVESRAGECHSRKLRVH